MKCLPKSIRFLILLYRQSVRALMTAAQCCVILNTASVVIVSVVMASGVIASVVITTSADSLSVDFHEPYPLVSLGAC